MGQVPKNTFVTHKSSKRTQRSKRTNPPAANSKCTPHWDSVDQWLLIGGGRVAHHLKHLFAAHSLSIRQWQRSTYPDEFTAAQKLVEECQQVQGVLIAVSDSALAAVISLIPEPLLKIHFSGCLSFPGCVGLHPLMSFGWTLQELEVYGKIALVCDTPNFSLRRYFPKLQNPEFYIEPDMKPFYHALCTIGVSGPLVLWSVVEALLKNVAGLSSTDIAPFKEKCLDLAKSGVVQNGTGPWFRGDLQTIEQHQIALTAGLKTRLVGQESLLDLGKEMGPVYGDLLTLLRQWLQVQGASLAPLQSFSPRGENDSSLVPYPEDSY